MTKREIIEMAVKAAGNCDICYAADYCPYWCGINGTCLCHLSLED